MVRVFTLLGALSALLAVAAGAFGAHGLRARLSAEMLAVFEVGVRYQMYHALALIGVAWVLSLRPSRLAVAAGWLFAGGTACFSGTLYLLALSGERMLGAVTPLGGVMFLAGWTCLALAAWKSGGPA